MRTFFVPHTRFWAHFEEEILIFQMYLSILLERIYLSYDEQKNRMHFYANYGTACEYT